MTEIHITVRLDDESWLCVHVEGHGHKADAREVEAAREITELGRECEKAIMGLTGPGKFIGPQIDIVTRVVEGSEN